MIVGDQAGIALLEQVAAALAVGQVPVGVEREVERACLKRRQGCLAPGLGFQAYAWRFQAQASGEAGQYDGCPVIGGSSANDSAGNARIERGRREQPRDRTQCVRD